jgi:hypothetical protein
MVCQDKHLQEAKEESQRMEQLQGQLHQVVKATQMSTVLVQMGRWTVSNHGWDKVASTLI